jgi:hypothetical protein
MRIHRDAAIRLEPAAFGETETRIDADVDDHALPICCRRLMARAEKISGMVQLFSRRC